MNKRKITDDFKKHNFDGMRGKCQDRVGKEKLVAGDRDSLSRSIVTEDLRDGMGARGGSTTRRFLNA